MPEPTHDPEVTDLESALRGLRPRADLDREALMFQAGRASAGRGWGWPVATAAALALAAGMAVLVFIRPAPPVVERIVHVPAPAAPQPPPDDRPSPPPSQEPTATTSAESAEAPGSFPYPGPPSLREHVLRWGLDGLPPVPDSAPTPPGDSPASLLRTQ
jgi:hypothetical protein